MEQQRQVAELQTQTEAQSAAQRRPLERTDVKHRILGLVVHGVGEQTSGSTLKHVLNEFYPLIRERIDRGASIAVKPLDEGDPAEVQVWFRHGEPEAGDTLPPKWELRVTEVWYAKSFSPLAFDNFFAGVTSFAGNMWRRRKERGLHLLPPLRNFLNVTFLQRAIVVLAVALLWPLALLLLIALWLLQSIGPLQKSMPSWITTPQRFLTKIVTNQLGDMWVYMRQPWEAAQMRVRFEERLHQVVALLDEGGEENIDAVFVVAHSMGTAVSFEALTGSRVGKLIESNFGEAGKPVFYFITVGSALNAAWDTVPEAEEERFYRALPAGVRWINLDSSHDPVPRGDLRPPPEVQPQPSQPPVLNQMDMFADHASYWNNAEQVIAPILDAVTAGRMSQNLRMDTKRRRTRVNWLAAAKAAAWLVFVGALLGFLAVSFVPDARVVDWVADKVKDAPVIGGSDWLAKWLVSPLLWAVALAAVAAVVYSTVVKGLWNRWDRSVKYRWPEGVTPIPPYDEAG